MRARAAALAAVGLSVLLAGCTPVGTPSAGPGSTSATAGTPSASATATSPATTPTPTSTTATSAAPERIVLSGTSIGGQPLGHADVKAVDALIVAELGEATVGQPQLCEAGTRGSTAVVDHTWKGLTVRYGSTGAAAVAIAWTVDPSRVPDGFALVDGLPWAPTFATLEKMPGVQVSTGAGRTRAALSRLSITWSGPTGATRPDTVAGGVELSCG
ncbi:MAG: hypothetical protein LCH96_11720 [Actinobacteria bacterium]|nr:hypothetical protein [Actinomycetota bacterium]